MGVGGLFTSYIIYMELFYYRRLDVYQNVEVLVADIYKILSDFPREEQFALSSQIRRAAVSILSNIAEGFGRYSNKERLYFLGNANGSAMEVSAQIEIAETLGFIDKDTKERVDNQILTIVRQLAGLRKRIETSESNPPTPNT